MSRDTLRYVIALGLLVFALALVGVLIWLPGRHAMPVTGAGFVFASDIDNWRQTDLSRLLHSPYDFSVGPQLQDIPMQLGPWQGHLMAQDNLEVFILLEPEEYLYRLYRRDDGVILWLSMIGSRKSKSFHPPQICYSADGWRTQVGTASFPLERGEVNALRVDAEKGEQRHLVVYFFLWPDVSRDPTKGTVLFKITAPIYGTDVSDEEVLRSIADFLSEFFTEGARG